MSIDNKANKKIQHGEVEEKNSIDAFPKFSN